LLLIPASTLILGSEPQEAHDRILSSDDSGDLQATLSTDMYIYTVNLNGREPDDTIFSEGVPTSLLYQYRFVSIVHFC
jgi:hypothetical protein